MIRPIQQPVEVDQLDALVPGPDELVLVLSFGPVSLPELRPMFDSYQEFRSTGEENDDSRLWEAFEREVIPKMLEPPGGSGLLESTLSDVVGIPVRIRCAFLDFGLERDLYVARIWVYPEPADRHQPDNGLNLFAKSVAEKVAAVVGLANMRDWVGFSVRTRRTQV